jgi:hypothetical protein
MQYYCSKCNSIKKINYWIETDKQKSKIYEELKNIIELNQINTKPIQSILVTKMKFRRLKNPMLNRV